MNLAATLVVVFWLACALTLAPGAPATGLRVQSATQSPPQQTSPPSPSASPAQQTPATKAATKPKPRKRKPGNTATNCAAAGQKKNSQNTTGKAIAANCPPQKTVVRNGGTSEPAEQLTEGERTAQAQQRSTTDQLLGSTEDNLKKIAGRPLTAAQKDMVSQVRLYIEQSKEAVTSGDTERGRMLAQKAQLLSDELVKP